MYDDDDTKAQDMMFMCIEESGEDLKYCKFLRKIKFFAFLYSVKFRA